MSDLPQSATQQMLNVILHACGLTKHGEGVHHRNHFACLAGSNAELVCNSMCEDGYMTRRRQPNFPNARIVFFVTDAGKQWALENAPKKTTNLRKQQLKLLAANCLFLSENTASEDRVFVAETIAKNLSVLLFIADG